MKGKDMKKSKLIKDMSIYEASEFWDEHDFTEFEDTEEVKYLRVTIKKKKYVGVDMSLYNKIKNKARKLHITENDLINEWLMEKAKS